MLAPPGAWRRFYVRRAVRVRATVRGRDGLVGCDRLGGLRAGARGGAAAAAALARGLVVVGAGGGSRGRAGGWRAGDAAGVRRARGVRLAIDRKRCPRGAVGAARSGPGAHALRGAERFVHREDRCGRRAPRVPASARFPLVLARTLRASGSPRSGRPLRTAPTAVLVCALGVSARDGADRSDAPPPAESSETAPIPPRPAILATQRLLGREMCPPPLVRGVPQPPPARRRENGRSLRSLRVDDREVGERRRASRRWA